MVPPRYKGAYLGTEPDTLPNQRIGPYRTGAFIGGGGFSWVIAAQREADGLPVALKVLKPKYANDKAFTARFLNEAEVAGQLRHPNIIRIIDVGQDGQHVYFAMPRLPRSLESLLPEGVALPEAEVARTARDIARALAFAHGAGVIHRDIKPQNMVVDPSGFLKVMDFGIARRTEGHRLGDEGLTAVGTTIGTPEYMAPEQLLGEDLDPRADLYATGAVLFECVTGRNVFLAPNVMALMAKHLEETPEDPKNLNPEVPTALSQVILKALAKKRDQRWSSAAELLHALEGVRLDETTAQTRAAVAAVTATS